MLSRVCRVRAWLQDGDVIFFKFNVTTPKKTLMSAFMPCLDACCLLLPVSP